MGSRTRLLHPQRRRRHGDELVVQPGPGFEADRRSSCSRYVAPATQPLPLFFIALRPASDGMPPVTSAARAWPKWCMSKIASIAVGVALDVERLVHRALGHAQRERILRAMRCASAMVAGTSSSSGTTG